MQLQANRILITGASGGIGQAVVRELVQQGARRLGLVDLRLEPLTALAEELKSLGCEALPIVADLTSNEGRMHIVREMQKNFSGIDLLINNAGILDFTEFADEDPEMIERTLRVNTIAPMQLVRMVLPDMLERNHGRIVNVGSVFGSIAFACFASYSASKFAMRGFSEALRRELAGSGIGVTYVAPRSVKTPLNTSAVNRMAEAVKMNMDEPARVAARIVRAIVEDRKDVYIGFPESLFVRINALWPRLVDMALRKQNAIMRRFTHES